MRAHTAARGFPHLATAGTAWVAAAMEGPFGEFVRAAAVGGGDADATGTRMRTAVNANAVLRGVISDEWCRYIKLMDTFWNRRWGLTSTAQPVPDDVRQALPETLPGKQGLDAPDRKQAIAAFARSVHVTTGDKAAAVKVFGNDSVESLACVWGRGVVARAPVPCAGATSHPCPCCCPVSRPAPPATPFSCVRGG